MSNLIGLRCNFVKFGVAFSANMLRFSQRILFTHPLEYRTNVAHKSVDANFNSFCKARVAVGSRPSPRDHAGERGEAPAAAHTGVRKARSSASVGANAELRRCREGFRNRIYSLLPKDRSRRIGQINFAGDRSRDANRNPILKGENKGAPNWKTQIYLRDLGAWISIFGNPTRSKN